MARAEIGGRIPDLAVTTHDGTDTRLSTLAGERALVVFFYPKAFTAGCTAQACHFRDLAAEFAEVGAARVGVSRASGATPARFAERHDFDFPLIGDPDGAVSAAFGAKRIGPVPTRRQTYVLDRDLTLLHVVSSEVDMERHADEALAFLRERATT
ncbi:MAG: peroxiredoxin [Nitriliruptoraceae bacterium]